MTTLGNMLHDSAERTPNKIAIVFENERISYRDLDRSTSSLARWLIDQGCRPGDRVALYWPNSIDIAKLQFACFKARLIAVPINISMRVPEVNYVLSHSKAVMCFAHPDLLPAAEEAGRGCTALRAIRNLPPIFEEKDAADGLPNVTMNDTALVLYTSGTTTRPKGVTHTHRSLLEMVRLVDKMLPNGIETALLSTQMTYITALSGCFLPAISKGGTTVVLKEFDASLVLDMIEHFQCNYMIGLPSMAQLMTEEQAVRPRNVESLLTIIVVGDSTPVSAQERFRSVFGISLREGYGMTEVGPLICNPQDRVRPGTLGTTIDGVTVRIVDLQGHDLPDGETGEIIVRTPAMFAGYWADPAATSQAMNDGWLHTGDLGKRDAEGYIQFDGRQKEIIVHGGYNISPQEVEEAICDHPAVCEVAVIGAPAPIYGEDVVAFVALRDGVVVDEQELRIHAGRRLAELKVPKKIVFLRGLPKGITGKIQRRALKEMALHAVA